MRKIFLVLLSLFIYAMLFVQEGTVLDNKVCIRNTPSIQYSQVVGVANKGDRLNILSYTNDTDKIDGSNELWYEVKFNDLENCYIYGEYFKPDSDNFGQTHAAIRLDVLNGVLKSISFSVLED